MWQMSKLGVGFSSTSRLQKAGVGFTWNRPKPVQKSLNLDIDY
jgi:hypothetical protein